MGIVVGRVSGDAWRSSCGVKLLDFDGLSGAFCPEPSERRPSRGGFNGPLAGNSGGAMFWLPRGRNV